MRTRNAFLVAMSVVLTAGMAFGQPIVNEWVSDPEDNLWNNPDNWSLGVVPGTGTTRIEQSNADVLLDGPATVLSGGLVVAGLEGVTGVTLTVKNSLTGGASELASRPDTSGQIIVDGGSLQTTTLSMATQTGSVATLSLINGGNLTMAGGGDFTVGSGIGATTQVDILAGSTVLSQAPGPGSTTIGAGGGDSFHRLQLGDASGAGTMTQVAGFDPRDLNLRTGAFQSDVEFRGHGTVSYNGVLRTNGRVVADGFGTDRTLDMTSFSESDGYHVTRTFAANSDLVTYTGAVSGWYAVNGGRLELPGISMNSPNPSPRWGDSSGNQGMVNSVYTTFTGHTMGFDGVMTIALLSTDRTDIPDAPPGVTFIGVWDINRTGAGGFSTATMTFRYDDAAREALGLPEEDLRIWHYTGGEWVNVFGSIDMANKRITSTAVNSFSLFAVGIPEPGSLLLLGAGSLLLLSRRRGSV